MTDWLRDLAERAAHGPALYVGLMSGTSADGVDAALVELAGVERSTRVREIAFVSAPYPDTIAQALRGLASSSNAVADVCALNVGIAEAFANAANRVLAEGGVDPQEVVAIGSHGQTVWHTPRTAGHPVTSTLQIGNPAVLAARTGVPVVSDFRSADAAAGGQAAPLVPYVDWMLFTSEDASRAVQNIGGVANVTHLPRAAGADDVIAFDTGPGNVLIDGVIRKLTRGDRTLDLNGAIAAQGTVDDALVDAWMENAYFAEPPPKSTGPEYFNVDYLEARLTEARRRGLSDADVVATVTALTARSITDAYVRFLSPRGGVDEVIVSGGGARNPVLMGTLEEALGRAGMCVLLRSSGDWGVGVDSKEAVAFALLARETLRGVPANLPSATGAARAVLLGSVTPAWRGSRSVTRG